MRLRVQLDPSLCRTTPNYQQPKKFWWQPSGSLQSVEQLLDELGQQLGLPSSGQLVAELDGFAVLPGSGVGVLREGDLILLNLKPQKRKAVSPPAAQPVAQPAKQQKLADHATAAVRQQLQLGRKSGALSDESSRESSPASSTTTSSESREGTGADTKSERFYTPATKLATPASEAAPGQPGTAGAEAGGMGAGEGAAKQRPSRSARRKAAKRRLRREGVLPPSTGKKKGQQQQQQQQQQGEQLVEFQAEGAAAEAAVARAAGAGASTARVSKKRKQQQQQEPGWGLARGVDAALEAAATANAFNPHADPKRPVARGGAGAAAAPALEKPAHPSKAGRGEAVGAVLHPGGLMAKGSRQGGHVYFGGSSSSSEEEEEEEEEEAAALPPAVARDGGAAAGWGGQAAWDTAAPSGRRDARQGHAEVALPQHSKGSLAPETQPAEAAGLAGHGEAGAGTGAAQPSIAQPMSDEEFGSLPPVAGAPAVGSMMAYKLLEIGPNFAPQVSEVRLGRVAAFDAGSSCLTLVPHPDPGTHPLAWQWAAARAAQAAAAGEGLELEEEEEEEEEQDLGPYEEDGALSAELSSFVELRVLAPAPGMPAPAPAHTPAQRGAGTGPSQGAAVVPPSGVAPAAGAAPAPGAAQARDGAGELPGDLGPSSYSQLGPPRSPAAASAGGTVIPPEGGWAALYQQLKQRRAELAAQQQQQQVPDRGKANGAAARTSASSEREVTAAPLTKGADASHHARQGKRQQVLAGPPAPLQLPQPGGAGSMAVQIEGQGATRRPEGLTPGAARPRGGVRASAMGPILRMLRSTNELE